jgi:hypothetical protein
VQAPADQVIEADISRLESEIRQLKVQYDMFLVGALPREPHELRSNVQRMIKRYSNAPIRKYQHRFQFNALVARFNCLSELWGKTLRSMEEGDRPAPAVAERADRRREKTLATCHVSPGNGADPAELRNLHDRFLSARRRAGENGDIPYEAFARKIAAQASHLKQKTGCEDVELRLVVHDRKVQLKARPGR